MLAVMLGPAGVGLAALYFSITTVVGTLTGFGLGNSGVREIAEANKAGDRCRVARVATVVLRFAIFSNIIGALLVCVFQRALSQATFGDTRHAGGVALMGLVILFNNVANAQTCVLQGLQRLKELVNCQIFGALLGTVSSVLIVFFMGERGVAWYLVAFAVFSLIPAWWYLRRVQFPPARVNWARSMEEIRKLFRLGLGVMSSVLLASGVLYITRIIIIRKLGLAASGQYHAAYTLTAFYVGFILRAISTDFFPRLSGLSNEHPAANRLMNEQMEIGLLLALPPLLATLVFAPWVLRILYTGEFVAAAAIVRWQVIGIFFGMVSWPLWHLQLAKGLGLLLLITETLFSLWQVFLYWLCINQWGLAGAGFAYLLACVAHAIGLYFLCRKLSGFACSRRVLLVSIPGLILLLGAFAAQQILPAAYGLITGLILCLVGTVASVYGLQKILGVPLKTLLPRRFAANPFTTVNNVD